MERSLTSQGPAITTLTHHDSDRGGMPSLTAVPNRDPVVDFNGDGEYVTIPTSIKEHICHASSEHGSMCQSYGGLDHDRVGEAPRRVAPHIATDDIEFLTGYVCRARPVHVRVRSIRLEPLGLLVAAEAPER